jgi:hypothetical protein
MAPRTPKSATADDVRAWAQKTDWHDEHGREVAGRGRLHSKLVTDFDSAMKRFNIHYVPGYKRQVGEQMPAALANIIDGGDGAERQESQAAPARQQQPPKQQRQNDAAPAQVRDSSPVREVKRVATSGGDLPAVHIEGIADAIAMLQAAKSAKKAGDPPVLVAFYSLV